MSGTAVQLSDVVIPEVYRSYTAIDNPEKSAIITSGIVSRSTLFDQIARSGGKNSILPFWKDIDPSIEPNYSNDDPEDEAVPHGITTGSMNTRKAFVNQSFREMDLVQELAGASPMQHIKNRFGTYWTRQQDRRLSAMCVGIFKSNISKNSSDMVVDITGKTGADAVFGSDAFIDAAFTRGDQADGFAALMVHSIIMARMVKNNDIVYIPDSQGLLTIPTYKGHRVVMVDNPYLIWSGTGAATKFLSIIFGQGAIGFGNADGSNFAVGEGIPKVDVETYREPQKGNGGGAEAIIERKTWIMHPFGFNWTDPSGGAALTEFSPKYSDLITAGPWTRVVDRKLIPMAAIISFGQAQA